MFYYSTQDFDDDGISECVGFTVSEISIFTTADNEDNLLVGEYRAGLKSGSQIVRIFQT